MTQQRGHIAEEQQTLTPDMKHLVMDTTDSSEGPCCLLTHSFVITLFILQNFKRTYLCGCSECTAPPALLCSPGPALSLSRWLRQQLVAMETAASHTVHSPKPRCCPWKEGVGDSSSPELAPRGPKEQLTTRIVPKLGSSPGTPPGTPQLPQGSWAILTCVCSARWPAGLRGEAAPGVVSLGMKGTPWPRAVSSMSELSRAASEHTSARPRRDLGTAVGPRVCVRGLWGCLRWGTAGSSRFWPVLAGSCCPSEPLRCHLRAWGRKRCWAQEWGQREAKGQKQVATGLISLCFSPPKCIVIVKIWSFPQVESISPVTVPGKGCPHPPAVTQCGPALLRWAPDIWPELAHLSLATLYQLQQ